MTESGQNCFFFLILAPTAFLLVLLFSCVSTPEPERADAGKIIQEQKQKSPADAAAVPLKIPDKVNSSYFRSIPVSVMNDIISGSPAALRSAVGKLRKASIDYTEPEKVLLSVAAGIMKIAWPTETAGWETPPVTQPTAYLGAIDSAVKGVYDSSTGNDDFLTLVLPSLLLLTNNARTDYYTDSETSLKLALVLAPDSVLANYLLGALYRRQGKKEALTYFSAAARNAPDCLQTAYAWAESLHTAGKESEALGIARQFVDRYPNDIPLLKLCAETTFALGNYSSAELYVARVLQQNPSDISYILFRAHILVEEEDYIKAASLLDVYARTDTSARDYLMLRARIQRDWNRNINGAVETMGRAVSLYPDDPDVILLAAEIAASSGEPVNGKSASDLANIVLAKDPANVTALDIVIRELIREKRWSEAYTASLQLIKKPDAPPDSIYIHIKICLALSRTDEAWSLISPLYEKKPSDEQVLQSYLEVLYATGRRTESAAIINSLLPDASSRMKSFLYYRRSFLVNGEQAVLADLRSSLIANPRNEDALYRLYTIYYDKSDYRKAQYYLKQVVALNPSNEDLLKKNADLEKILSR